MSENLTEKVTEKIVTEVAEATVQGKSWKEKAVRGAAIVGGAGLGAWVLVKLYRKFGKKPATEEQAAQA